MRLLFVVLLLSFGTYAQSGYARYDINTYKGPINQGWLFDDQTYKTIYSSFKIKQQLIESLKEQTKSDSILLKTKDEKILTLQERNNNYQSQIADKDTAYRQLNKQLNECLNHSTTKIDKSVYKRDIVKFSIISVVSGIVVGYAIGKF